MAIGDRHLIGSQRALQTHSKRSLPVPSQAKAEDPPANLDQVRVGQGESSEVSRQGVLKKLAGKVGGLFSRKPPTREWTVLFYANGNSDLEARELDKLHQLGDGGSGKTTTIVAQTSLGSQGGVGQRYEIAQKGWGEVTTGPGDLKKQEDLGKVNMGSEKTFTDALLWMHEKYPAKHYMVVVSGHGEGPRGGLHDDIHNDKLTANEIDNGFAALKEARGGKSTEVVVANSCLLGSGELEYQLRDSAEYYVGSQEVLQTSDINFRKIAKGMKKKGLEPRQAAEVVMQAADPLTRTLSVVDLSKMDGVGKAMKTFTSALDQSQPTDRLRLNSLAKETQDFMKVDGVDDNHPFKSYRDIGHFAQLVRQDKTLENPKLREAADGIFKAVGAAVVANHTSAGYENSHGISMNIAAGNQAGPGEYYSDLSLNQDTGWSGSLNHQQS